MMLNGVKQTPLLRFLRQHSTMLHGKSVELRGAVQNWLAYIPKSFPHYTQHTLPHSDEIISQVSKVLFVDGDPGKPVIQMSGVEAFVLIAAAYLHDVGMVVSDEEQARILGDQGWEGWVRDGTGTARWERIRAVRAGEDPDTRDSPEPKRHFLADVQTRFLIAEYIRRSHHLRSADLIMREQDGFAHFGFDDPILVTTIADVCAAHGLEAHQLEDGRRYPSDKDVLGEPVNVRLMAVLIRLGDLLDLRYDRACPLLMSAACPLPGDSIADWTQYQRFTDRTTRPNAIRIAAVCQSQEEHRTIRDWCQWIVDECREARALAGRFDRHAGWCPPRATITGTDPSIVIEPAPEAVYVWRDWRLELEEQAVFQRLIYDVYDRPNVFVRELIQNALDATRCQLYADLKNSGATPPKYPTEVPGRQRQQYAIRISLCERAELNGLSQEEEKRQVLVVEDPGIGMDDEVVERYFLQVGRSFYTTPEFRRLYRFVPTSRFGLGFLSVFAESDRVVVDTYKPSAGPQASPIRLTLTGPRSYLLSERSDRDVAGTRVEVELVRPMSARELVHLVEGWCVKVEFPIHIDAFGEHSTVLAEDPRDFECERLIPAEPGVRLAVRRLPLDVDGIEGEFYVVERCCEEQVRWDVRRYYYPQYLEAHPGWDPPKLPRDVCCLHGIKVQEGRWVGGKYNDDIGLACRLDLRADNVTSDLPRTGLARTQELPRSRSEALQATLPKPVLDCMYRALDDHVASLDFSNDRERWEYVCQLGNTMLVPSYWSSRPDSMCFYRKGQQVYGSVRDALTDGRLVLMVHVADTGPRDLARDRFVPAPVARRASQECSALVLGDSWRLSDPVCADVFESLRASAVIALSREWLGVHLDVRPNQADWPKGFSGRWSDIVPFGNPALLGFRITYHSLDHFDVINGDHPIAMWLRRLRSSSEDGDCQLPERQFGVTMEVLRHAFAVSSPEGLLKHLSSWRASHRTPSHLCPPEVEIGRDALWISSTDQLPSPTP